MILDVMSAIVRGFGTRALNGSLKRFERSPLFLDYSELSFVGSNPAVPTILNTPIWGRGLTGKGINKSLDYKSIKRNVKKITDNG